MNDVKEGGFQKNTSFFCFSYLTSDFVRVHNFIFISAMSTSTDATSVTTNFSVSGETLQFGSNEKDILAYWKQINAFETSNRLSKDRPK
jgi:hypothetical protein